MSEWREVTLGDMTEKGMYGYTESANSEKVGPHFLRITDIQNGVVDWSTVPYCPISEKDKEKYLLEENDIVVARTGNSTGENYIFEGNLEAVFASYLIRFRVLENVAFPKYVWYNMRTFRWKAFINGFKSGSAQEGANANTLREFPFLLPELPIQKEIARILSNLDKKITLLRQQNQDLEELAQTLFKRWFVEFEFPNENGEPYKSSGGKMVESELGEIPEGWRVVRLQDIVEIGSSKRIFAKEYLQDGIPFYRGKEITELSNGNNLTVEIYIAEQKYNELKETSGAPKENDVLLTSVGTIGNTYMVQKGERFYFKDGNLTWFKEYKTYIDSTFIYTWLNSKYAEVAIEGIKIGSTQQAITIASLNTIAIAIPNEETYLKLKDSLKSTISKRQTNSKEIQTLTQLRDTLLPKLMSGELRVK
jgi:type I restriction enzyme S subunit